MFFSSKSRETSRSCASRHQRYGGKAFKRFARPRGGPGLVYWDDWPRSGVVREPPFSHVLAPDRGRLYLENGPGSVPRFSPVLPGPPRLPGGATNRPVDACFPPPAVRLFVTFLRNFAVVTGSGPSTGRDRAPWWWWERLVKRLVKPLLRRSVRVDSY